MDGLTKEQLLAVLRSARAASEREWLMCVCSYWHGLRASEITGFKRDAVQDGYLTIARVKGSERTTQLLIKHSHPLLDERVPLETYCLKSSSNAPVFKMSVRTWERKFKRLALAAGIPEHLAHPHVLKHTAAHHLIETEGVKLHEVKKRLGHKSLQSTGKYLEIRDSQADAAAAKVTFET